MLLVIDNYDSFVYNLVQYIAELGQKEILVKRNDKIEIEEIKRLSPSKIIISPGPGRPEQAGISNQVIKHFGKTIPILGVCLGHQCIGQVFGGKIIRAKRLLHGMTSSIHHNGKTIFKGVKNPFDATRYHSLIVDRKTLPACLRVTAQTEEKEIMGLEHSKFPIWGVQFHPESILTTAGKNILKNFLSY